MCLVQWNTCTKYLFNGFHRKFICIHFLKNPWMNLYSMQIWNPNIFVFSENMKHEYIHIRIWCKLETRIYSYSYLIKILIFVQHYHEPFQAVGLMTLNLPRAQGLFRPRAKGLFKPRFSEAILSSRFTGLQIL